MNSYPVDEWPVIALVAFFGSVFVAACILGGLLFLSRFAIIAALDWLGL